jgi:hypothetical protein
MDRPPWVYLDLMYCKLHRIQERRFYGQQTTAKRDFAEVKGQYAQGIAAAKGSATT